MAVKLNTFHCLCLKRILRIRWQQKMTNKSVIELAEIIDISCEVSRRAWNWLGHILRREGEDDSFTALGWAPKGRGREEDRKLLGEGQSGKNETKLDGRALGRSMTFLGPHQPEAKRSIDPIVAPKRQTIISCWNVRTTGRDSMSRSSSQGDEGVWD